MFSLRDMPLSFSTSSLSCVGLKCVRGGCVPRSLSPLLSLLDIYRSEVITGTRVSGAYDPAVCVCGGGGGTVMYLPMYIHTYTSNADGLLN